MNWKRYKYAYLSKRVIRSLANNHIQRRFLWYKRFGTTHQAKEGHQSLENYSTDGLSIGDFQFKIRTAFEKDGIAVERFRIDKGEFNEYLKMFLPASPLFRWVYGDMLSEKMVEYFFSSKVLRFTPEDVYIDVASAFSDYPSAIRKNIGCVVYRQDIDYRAGLHEDFIGGDAKAIPLPDRSVTKISLHNSFEHFEGTSDIEFIKEASRLLKRGGG